MRHAAFLLGLVVVAAMVAHSLLFVWRFPATLAPAGELGPLEALRVAGWTGPVPPWVSDYFRYYPPLYQLWLGLCPWPGGRLAPALLVFWSDLPLAAGFLTLAAGLRRLSGSGAASVGCLLLLAGFPLVNAYLKTVNYECGLLAATAALLGVLWGLEPEPGWRSAVILGVLAGAGLLCKWTLPLYVAGPVAVAFLSRLAARWTPLQAARWAGLAGLTAVLVAGPWYLFWLDRARLAATAANDVTFPGAEGWQAYRRGFELYWAYLGTGVGRPLMLLALVGWVVSFVRRSGFAVGAALSAGAPLVVLAAFPHHEPRYLLAGLPALAAGAAVGLAEIPSSAVRRVALVLLAGVAALQSIEATWVHRREPCQPEQVGPLTLMDTRMRLYAPGLDVAAVVCRAQLRWSTQFFTVEHGGTLGVHPLETLGVVKCEMLAHQYRLEPAESLYMETCGYNWSEYRRFLTDLDAGRPDLMLVSESTLRVSLEQGHFWARNAWGYVAQAGPVLAAGGGGPPDDPFLIERIDRDYGVLEAVPTRCGPVFLLIRRELWARAGHQVALPGLPRLPRAKD